MKKEGKDDEKKDKQKRAKVLKYGVLYAEHTYFPGPVIVEHASFPRRVINV